MQSATMFSKAATSGFAIQARPTKAQRRGAVAVRAGPYDAELVETAVSIMTMRWEILGSPAVGDTLSSHQHHPERRFLGLD